LDLALSEDQQFFRDTTRKYLLSEWPMSRVRGLIDDPLGFDRGAWQQGAELGWFSMLVPEELGGGSVSGAGVSDLAIVAEELGRVVFPGPVLPTNVVALALATEGSSAQQAAHLPGIVGGEVIATWAIAEANDRWDGAGVGLEATPSAGGFRLHGTKHFVQDAHVADLLLVAARTAGGLSQFLVPATAAGITIEPLQSLDLGRRLANVAFDGVEVSATDAVGDIDGAEEAIRRQLNVAVALQSAETVGALDALFDMTLAYAKDRKAFGRPIGSFQALKHRLADMLLWLESSKAAAVAAAHAADAGNGAASDELASVAKCYIGERGPEIARDCLQIHGGIGFTWEHDLHLYLRRVEANAALYGSPDRHRDRLATALGMTGVAVGEGRDRG